MLQMKNIKPLAPGAPPATSSFTHPVGANVNIVYKYRTGLNVRRCSKCCKLGSLHGPVTWYKISDARLQVMQNFGHPKQRKVKVDYY